MDNSKAVSIKLMSPSSKRPPVKHNANEKRVSDSSNLTFDKSSTFRRYIQRLLVTEAGNYPRGGEKLRQITIIFKIVME